MTTYFKLHTSGLASKIAFSHILLKYKNIFSFYIHTKYTSWHFSTNLSFAQKAADLILTPENLLLNETHSYHKGGKKGEEIGETGECNGKLKGISVFTYLSQKKMNYSSNEKGCRDGRCYVIKP